MNITRHHLVGWGASQYLAIKLTKSCQVQGKEKRCNLYSAIDVKASIKDYLKHPSIRKTTKNILGQILQELSPLVSNVISVPFGTSESIVSQMTKGLIASMLDSKDHQYRLEATAIKGKHKKLKHG